MNIETAKKLLNMYLELNPFRHDLGIAIKTVLAELDKQEQTKAEMRKVAFEEGYNQGLLEGIIERIYEDKKIGSKYTME